MRVLGPLSTPASRLLPFRRAPLQSADPRSRIRPRRVLDPGGDVVLLWNRVFLVFCMLGLFTDPLHFFLLYVGGNGCMKVDSNIAVIATVLRTLADLSYVAHMILKFRTAFVAPSSRVFGRGELVTDPRQIAVRYLKREFAMDFIAMLPIPQILIWFVIPAVSNSSANHTNRTLSIMVLFQYLPRLVLTLLLHQRIIYSTGDVSSAAWIGAAYNLMLYMLASHCLGALWYLLSMERQYGCWLMECKKEMGCDPIFLDCNSTNLPARRAWIQTTSVLNNCDPTNSSIGFNFGMFADALNGEIIGASFFAKYLYCLWWGLRNLSSYGQNLATSTYVREIFFAISICIGGLVLFAHLIGNMETYLQSLTVRVEEWRVKRRDTEEWMRHRQLPLGLQDHVRRFFQYKWLATRGVDEESILRSLPLDLRREIQRHLCLSLVKRVPFFSQMDDQLLDAICERLVSTLSTKDTYLVREGDPVNEMLFVIRGELESSTTNGGRSGFFNCITLGPGDFCGEELLTWALMPNTGINMPLSTRTVRALGEVEAFALRAEDLKFVAHQFKRLHSKKLQHAFRYYSHQWRTWGACFIQAAWRRFKRKKLARELAEQENLYVPEEDEDLPLLPSSGNVDSAGETPKQWNPNPLGATLIAASKFAKNTKKGAAAAHHKVQSREPVAVSSLKMPKLVKPDEPDFSMHADDGDVHGF